MGAVVMKGTSTGFWDRGYLVTTATLYIYCDACGSFSIKTYIHFMKLIAIAAILAGWVLLVIAERQLWFCVVAPPLLALPFVPWERLLISYKCRKCGNVRISGYNSRKYEPYDMSVIDVGDKYTQKRYEDTTGV